MAAHSQLLDDMMLHVSPDTSQADWAALASLLRGASWGVTALLLRSG